MALACLPFPFLFYKYGASIRAKCKYAAQADAFMKRLRDQGPPKQRQPQADHESSITQAEEDAEQEAVDYSYEDEAEPRFEEMRTAKEKEELGGELAKVRTGRSARSTRTNRTGRSTKSIADNYYDNPYEIDRVNTRESFREGRPRSSSQTSNRPRLANRLTETLKTRSRGQ